MLSVTAKKMKTTELIDKDALQDPLLCTFINRSENQWMHTVEVVWNFQADYKLNKLAVSTIPEGHTTV